MRRQQYRSIRGRGAIRQYVVHITERGMQRPHSEIDRDFLAGTGCFLAQQPPRCCYSVPINWIGILTPGIEIANQYGRGRDRYPSHAVEPAEALAKRVQTCRLGDKGVKTEVRTDFEALRGNDNDR